MPLSDASTLKAYSFMLEQGSMATAVALDNVDQLKELIQKSRILDLAEAGKALLMAADKGKVECLEVLLDAGTSPDTKALGYTPFILAAQNGHLAIMHILHARGCNVMRTTHPVRGSALHWAVANGHQECVDFLLTTQIDRDAQTMHGRTAVMLAARNGRPEILKTLLNANCKVDIVERSTGYNALHHAAVEGWTDCVQMLLSAGIDPNATTVSGDSALIIAARKNRLETVEVLIKAGADVDGSGSCNMTAIHWACEGGFLEVVELLLEEGANPSVITTDTFESWQTFSSGPINGGCTPLMLAARGGHIEIMELLIKAGVDLVVFDKSGDSVLHYAVRSNRTACIELVIRLGLSPDLQQEPALTDTPLAVAMQEQKYHSLRALIQANCNIDAKVRPPIEEVMRQDSPFRSPTCSPFEMAVLRSHSAVMKMLALAGCDLSILQYWLETSCLPDSLKYNSNLLHWLLDVAFVHSSLKNLCRARIREVLGYQVKELAQKLPLPKRIIEYVTLADLDSIDLTSDGSQQ
ncbi:kinase D-interacting substrate of 220 kDa [Lingula anatina]|uniref:Kinase D-interacting substrate of 220 kDa n=1 Tax=Lingula anatina TaxID=7574 RepID=A0A1S3HHV9_LINAN|nr:kinase D-interacting substrate of 220 kDa [Lingula anatina]|eukprot:XP_013384574.1 kinase D-interacting substrate of 220 kDa [Lingula anatina]